MASIALSCSATGHDVDGGIADAGVHDAGADAGVNDAGIAADGGLVERVRVWFERIASSPNGRSFRIIVAGAEVTPSFIHSATLSKGTLSAWTTIDAGVIEAQVTPDTTEPTGVYTVTLSTPVGAITRSPIVMAEVNARWNQPELFAAPLNSRGWEDSPQVFATPNTDGGQTLHVALTYMPIRSSCRANPVATNPACNTIDGPYLTPDRPFMTIAPFVSADGGIDQQLPTLLGPGLAFPAKPNATLFVFTLDDDGYDGYLGTPKTNPHTPFARLPRLPRRSPRCWRYWTRRVPGARY